MLRLYARQCPAPDPAVDDPGRRDHRSADRWRRSRVQRNRRRAGRRARYPAEHQEHRDSHAFARRSDAASRKIRSEEHTSELQSLMRISYAVFCLKKKNNTNKLINTKQPNKYKK